MQIRKLLLENGSGDQLDRVVVLPPKLVVCVVWIDCPRFAEQLQHPLPSALHPVAVNGPKDARSRVLLQVPEDIRQGGALCRRGDQVNMVAHDHPGIKQQALLFLAIPETVHHDIPVILPCEDIHLPHRGKSDEVGAKRVVELVAAAHGTPKVAQCGGLETAIGFGVANKPCKLTHQSPSLVLPGTHLIVGPEDWRERGGD